MEFRFAGVEVSGVRRELIGDGRTVALEPKVFALILLLLGRRHRAVAKEELVAKLWPDTVVTESSLHRAVSIARRCLRDAGAPGSVIETVRGYGYRLSPRVPIEARASNEALPDAGVVLDLEFQRRAPPPRIDRSSNGEESSLEAQEHFSRGWLALAQFSPHANFAAAEHFRRAIELDASFARAHVGRANALIDLATGGFEPTKCFAKARRALDIAVEIEPYEATAWSLRGRIAWQHDWSWAEADRCFETALRLAPTDPEIWAMYAGYQTFVALEEEALESALRARALSPTSIYSVMVHFQALYFSGRYPAALEACKTVLELTPGFGFALFYAGLSTFRLEDEARAIPFLEAAWARVQRSDFGVMLAYAYAELGRVDEAEALFEDLLALARSGSGSVLAPILRELTLGDLDRALDAWEEAIAARDWHALITAVEPSCEPLRQHPRGRSLLDRVGLRGRGPTAPAQPQS